MSKKDKEEYLKIILDLAQKNGLAKTKDIATRLNIAPASVTEVLQRLAKNDMIFYEPYKGASLTKTGLKMATKLQRKHRLLEVFLGKVLQLQPENVHEQACQMEHVLSDETETALCRKLKGPAKCPHGRTIPPCSLEISSCKECLAQKNWTDVVKRERKKDIISMIDLPQNQKGKIAFIRGKQEVIKRLSDFGLTPKTEVSVLRFAPLKGPVEICVRGYNLAIGRNIAETIFVESEKQVV